MSFISTIFTPVLARARTLPSNLEIHFAPGPVGTYPGFKAELCAKDLVEFAASQEKGACSFGCWYARVLHYRVQLLLHSTWIS